MLSITDFKESALEQLLEIRAEIIELATDRDIYWKVQREVIQRNARLLTIRSAFFHMLNDSYAHATAARVRRLVDRDTRTISLRRLLHQLAGYPELFAHKVTPDELARDIDKLDQACVRVKDYVDQFVAHHDRSRSASAPTHRELNEAIDVLIGTFRKYYGVLAETDIDAVVSYLEQPFAIFRFPWLDPGQATQS